MYAIPNYMKSYVQVMNKGKFTNKKAKNKRKREQTDTGRKFSKDHVLEGYQPKRTVK
jgi:hypothetical protein